MPPPTLWIVGGPNGAGKTTLTGAPEFRALLRGVRFLNPDDVTLKLLREAGHSGFASATPHEQERCFVEAANIVEAELRAGIKQGNAMGVETVLSTLKYAPLVEEVLSAGGYFGLIYVALRSPDLSRQRVEQRVRLGGHGVPVEKLAARWKKSVSNLAWFACRAHHFWILDNSDSTAGVPPRLIALGGEGKARILDSLAIPEITLVLAGMPEC